jgi:hypothetical protein
MFRRKSQMTGIFNRTNIPNTADEWDLFTHTMDCSEAATQLTFMVPRAYEAFVKRLAEGFKVTDREPWGAAYEEYDIIAEKYRRFGAWDSEPRNIFMDTMEQLVGVEGVW